MALQYKFRLYFVVIEIVWKVKESYVNV